MPLIDIDGDGKDELVYIRDESGCFSVVKFNNDGVPLFPKTTWYNPNIPSIYAPQGFAPKGKNITRLYNLADVNGDGLPDLIIFNQGGVQVKINTGSGFSNSGFREFTLSFTNFDVHKTRRMMADVNGDGLADIVAFAQDRIWVSLSLGDSFDTPTATIADFCKNHGWMPDDPGTNNTYPKIELRDVNGDGKADIVGFSDKTWVALSKGKAFETTAAWSDSYCSTCNNIKHPRYLIDVNGDGLPDILRFDDYGIIAHLNTGGRFANGTRVSSSCGSAAGYGTVSEDFGVDKYPRLFGDFKGDGALGVIAFSHNGVGIMLSSTRYPRKVEKIYDGLGNGTSIGYEYQNQQSKNKNATEAYPYSAKIAPAILTKSIHTTNSTEDVRKESYDYAKPLFHYKGRGFLGFREITKNNLLTGGILKQTFVQQGTDIGYLNLLLKKQEETLPYSKKITTESILS